MTHPAPDTRIGGEGGATSVAEMAPAASPPARPESLLAQTCRRFKRSKTALAGLAIVLCMVVIAIFADVLAPYHPIRISQNETY